MPKHLVIGDDAVLFATKSVAPSAASEFFDAPPTPRLASCETFETPVYGDEDEDEADLDWAYAHPDLVGFNCASTSKTASFSARFEDMC